MPSRPKTDSPQFEISPQEDWTLFGFKSVRATFDSSFAVFADRLLAPTLDSSEVELIRTRLMTNARDVRLAAEADDAVATATAFDEDARAVVEHGLRLRRATGAPQGPGVDARYSESVATETLRPR